MKKQLPVLFLFIACRSVVDDAVHLALTGFQRLIDRGGEVMAQPAVMGGVAVAGAVEVGTRRGQQLVLRRQFGQMTTLLFAVAAIVDFHAATRAGQRLEGVQQAVLLGFIKRVEEQVR